ncbi:Uma2 family endonuclease [Aliterella atlantica]|uniref:Putative restriction endonuclease domain-containing protein n=1 Tax=Aliterella atlantica CENA595 TaxID=1618023 RepID=A0A0D8ZV05_9CYAN|nr:Uma2 family endonuclease [Aliterella atlantica]KJH72192.1 hypothetical protein UH38_09020 [Aliterella atlantica CENA595]
MSVELLRKQFTVWDYHQMVKAGILKEDERVELIAGEIIKMSPIGTLHAAQVKRLINLFAEILGASVIVAAQDPVQLSDYSEPQPDIALLKRRTDFYATAHPQPQDVLLLVEVADTTIDYDRSVKMPLYAASNISEAWIVDINGQNIEVYRQPASDGYQHIQTFQRGQSLFIQAFPEINLNVDELLG